MAASPSRGAPLTLPTTCLCTGRLPVIAARTTPCHRDASAARADRGGAVVGHARHTARLADDGGRAYATALLDVAARCGVQRIVSLGAVLAAVPHTRPPRVTGNSTDPAWQRASKPGGCRVA